MRDTEREERKAAKRAAKWKAVQARPTKQMINKDDPSEIIHRMCVLKKRYDTEAEALGDLRRFRLTDPKLTHYDCPWCNGWHIGHEISKQTYLRLRKIVAGFKANGDVLRKDRSAK